ncbi:MAG: hypothetical protein ACFBWO_13005 [Paracoccaceae bacterium]
MPFPFALHARRPGAPMPAPLAVREPAAPLWPDRPKCRVFERWRKETLLAEAQARRVEGCARMSKGELIAALYAAARREAAPVG